MSLDSDIQKISLEQLQQVIGRASGVYITLFLLTSGPPKHGSLELTRYVLQTQAAHMQAEV